MELDGFDRVDLVLDAMVRMSALVGFHDRHDNGQQLFYSSL